ncbi:MAG: Asp-tRNA(Asn)/Glu-tRNA(Gln) amidotransferase subunit GatA [Chloroherpetonaceae bacterium]
MDVPKTYFEFRKLAEKNELKTRDVLTYYFDNINSRQNLNSFITLREKEDLMQEAEKSDQLFKEGRPRKLEGMIIAIKDNISTKGLRTTCGSKMLENFIPVYNATVIERILSEGGIIIGKTNMDEFAMGSSNETSYFGPVHHPLDFDYVPGGSSGGSAVAVAANFCQTALGSDTGGSIRQPASLCGNIGLKPTYGRVSRFGLVAFASSLDQIGTFANSIEDSALLLDVISGKDPNDSTSGDLPHTNSFEFLQNKIPNNSRIAVLPSEQLKDCDADVISIYNKTLDKLKSMGCKINEVNLGDFDSMIATYYIIATAEASSNLARFDGMRYGFRAEPIEGADLITDTRSQGFGMEVKRRIMLGTYVLSSGYYEAYYGKALKSRKLIFDTYKNIFANHDFLFLPTSPTPAFRLGEKMNNPISMYLSDLFTTSANLANIPAISLPVGKSQDGFPIGMQLQANHFEEDKLLSFSKLLLNN